MKVAQQLASTILMVRPAHFGFNPETAENNAFQSNVGDLTVEEISEAAIQEFDNFVDKLRSYQIQVLVFQDTDVPLKTDAVFPNNWVSFHEDGLVVTYPMYSPNRRLERRADIIEAVGEKFEINTWIKLENHELGGRFLEATGSMILDRSNQIAYACRSDRTHPELFADFCQSMNFEPLLFTAQDEEGNDIYHTNVMMALGEKLAIICLDALPNQAERSQVEQRLKESGKEIVAISFAQMNAFAGNMIEVKNAEGENFLIMSSSAYHSLDMRQTERILAHTAIIHSSLEQIEKYGGGSARCMIAEIFLPPKA